MTSKEKKIKAFVELSNVQCRIDELKRSKTYLSSSTYYHRRLLALEEKRDELMNVLEGNTEEEKSIRLVFRVPDNCFKSDSKPDEIIQYLKREYLERS
jgi:hypothetical protein